MKSLRVRGRRFEYGGTIPAVMGILNVTPDSFSDGGSTVPLEERIRTLVNSGARILDVGGESTRPGAPEVPPEAEFERIAPAVTLAKKIFPDIFISVDTRKACVARNALELGADIINDVSGFRFDPEMPRTVATFDSGVVIMHSRALPETMQDSGNLVYSDLTGEVSGFLSEAAETALRAGIHRDSIILDPGFGFAKTAEQCVALLRAGNALRELGYPLLSGPSRKSFLGKITGETVPAGRDYATCGAAILSAVNGYEFLRVHNVKAVLDALKVFFAGI